MHSLMLVQGLFALRVRLPSSRTAVDALVGTGGAAIACVADVSTAVGIAAILEHTMQAYGLPDLVVNNAGLLGPLGPLYDNDANEWWRCLEVNLLGPMRMMQAVLPGMLRRNSGRIINVASGSGTSATSYMSAYVTSKAALIRLTELLHWKSRPRVCECLQ